MRKLRQSTRQSEAYAQEGPEFHVRDVLLTVEAAAQQVAVHPVLLVQERTCAGRLQQWVACRVVLSTSFLCMAGVRLHCSPQTAAGV